jgi:hypothetical protein
MAVEITSDTIVKILVRRGLESERIDTVLTEGELGYSIDTRRLFVGDGISLGGTPAGNKYLGETGDKNAYVPYASQGDTIYENNVLYAADGGGGWTDLNPKFYVTNGISNINADPFENKLRVSPDATGEGFSISYSDVPATQIQGIQGKLQFDSTYLSLCAVQNSFYFGSIANRKVLNNFDATVNVDKNIFINDINANPKQIGIYARSGLGNSLIDAISGDFDIQGKSSLNLKVNGKNAIKVSDTHVTTFSSARTGIAGSPDFDFYGFSQFRDNSLFSRDLTVVGNLSVQGDLTYLDTIVTVTSTLSVVNYNNNIDTVVIQQLGSVSNQSILRVMGPDVKPYLIIKDNTASGGGIAGININPVNNNYALVVDAYNSLGSINAYNGSFNVISDNGDFINIENTNGSKIYFNQNQSYITLSASSGMLAQIGAGGSSSYLTVSGAIRASQDIIAFAASDKNLKDNIALIDSPLEKLKKISGITFNWNDKSGKSGKDYGVIAQEVEEVLPEIVETRDDGYKAVRYEKIIPLLIEAIKALNK